MAVRVAFCISLPPALSKVMLTSGRPLSSRPVCALVTLSPVTIAWRSSNTGGPSSVFGDEAPSFDKKIFDIDIPILGICYGLQLLAHHHGGLVESNGQGEYGFAKIEVDDAPSTS